MKKLRVLSLLVIGMLSSSIFFGCGKSSENTSPKNSSASDSGVTLKVMTHRTDIVDTDLKDYAEEYKNKTGVNIEWVALENYDTSMQVKMRSNDDYGDVFMVPAISKEEYPKYIEPLGKASDADISPYKINKLTAIEENGDYTVYGLSYGLGAQGIVYNKAAFAAAGINAEDMKTFDGFLDGCQKLKDAGILPVAINFSSVWTLGNLFASAKCISGDGNYMNNLYKEDSIFDTSKPLGQVIELTGTLVNKGFTEEDLLNTDWDQSKIDLAKGKTAMMILGTWIISQERPMADNPDDIGFMPFPTEDGKTYTTLNTDFAVGISSKCKHKKEARDFVFAFNESDYAKDNSFIPNNQNLKEMDPVIQEFLDSGVIQFVEEEASPEDAGKTDEVLRKANIDLNTVFLKPLLYSVKSMDKLQIGIDDLNEDWNNAKNN